MHKHKTSLLRKLTASLILLGVLLQAVSAIDYNKDSSIGKAFEESLPRLRRRRVDRYSTVSIEKSSTISSIKREVSSSSTTINNFEHDGSELIDNINVYDPQVIYHTDHHHRPSYYDATNPSVSQTSQTIITNRPFPSDQTRVVYDRINPYPIVQPVIVRPSVVQPEPRVVVIQPNVIDVPTAQPAVQPVVQPVVSQVISPNMVVTTHTIPVNPYGVPIKEGDLDKLLQTKIQEAQSANGPNAVITGSISVTPTVRSLAQTSITSNGKLTSKRGQLKASSSLKSIQLAKVKAETEGLHTVTRRRRLAHNGISRLATGLAQVKSEQMAANGHRLSTSKGSLESHSINGAVNLAESASTTIGIQSGGFMDKKVNLAKSNSENNAESALRGKLGDHTAAGVETAQKLLLTQKSKSAVSASVKSSSTNTAAVKTASTTNSKTSVASAVSATSKVSAKASSTLSRPAPLQADSELDEDLEDEPAPSRLVSLAQTNKGGLAAMKTVGELRAASYITSFASVNQAVGEGLLNSVKF